MYSWAREEAAGPKLWSVACFCLHALAFPFSGPRVTVALLSQYAQVEAVWALLSSTLWQHGLGQCHERSGGRVFASMGSTLVALPEWVLVVEAAQRMQSGEGGWEDRPSGCCGWLDACMDAEQPLLHACLGKSSVVLSPQLTSACIMVCWGYGGLLLVGLCLLASDFVEACSCTLLLTCASARELPVLTVCQHAGAATVDERDGICRCSHLCCTSDLTSCMVVDTAAPSEGMVCSMECEERHNCQSPGVGVRGSYCGCRAEETL